MNDTSDKRETCIIFDVDGTLADTTHRLHHLTKEPKDWDGFFNGMENDPPHQEMVDLLNMFFLYADHAIVAVTGRDDSKMQQTYAWFTRNDIPHANIFFRAEGDRRPDHIVKRDILRNQILPIYRPILVFDDRPDVVRMWLGSIGSMSCRSSSRSSRSSSRGASMQRS
jgi:phosphoglycolate phosphatase-like HAD superfamily hydrolase